MDLARRYDRLAKRYDAASRVPNLLGFRDRRYHRAAVDLLAPEPGSIVWVPGCGTGIDFARLEEHIGPTGRIIATDISPGMLDKARQRCLRAGWENVEFHVGDHASHVPEANHCLASFTLKFNPHCREFIHLVHDALPKGGRLAVADFHVPRALFPLAALALATFGHTRASLARRPDLAMETIFSMPDRQNFWFGLAYAVVGTV